MIKQPRQHKPDHLAFVRQLPCCVCGNDIETEAAHIRMGCDWAAKRATGMGEKPSDFFTVPLCGRCHRDQHKINEQQFWIERGKDPVCIALALWAHTGNHELGERVVRSDAWERT